MRLFKGSGNNSQGHHGHGGGGGHSFFSHLRGHRAPRGGRDNDTIGSDIDTKDQFDIMIPLGPSRGHAHTMHTMQNWRFVERSDTMVSSITNVDEIRLKHDKTVHRSSRSNTGSWCCCSTVTPPTATCETENSLRESHKDLHLDEDREQPPQKPEVEEEEEEASPWSWCGSPFPDSGERPVCNDTNNNNDNDNSNNNAGGTNNNSTRSKELMAVADLARNNSLFDPLSEEEDGPEVPSTIHMKRIRQRVRRALPWKRNRSSRNRSSRGSRTPAVSYQLQQQQQQQQQVAPASHE